MASEHRLKILLDANVIFSGFHGSGPPRQIIDAAGYTFTPFVTDEVISEVLRNIARKAPIALAAVEVWLENAGVQVWEVLPGAIREHEETFGKDAHIVA